MDARDEGYLRVGFLNVNLFKGPEVLVRSLLLSGKIIKSGTEE